MNETFSSEPSRLRERGRRNALRVVPSPGNVAQAFPPVLFADAKIRATTHRSRVSSRTTRVTLQHQRSRVL